MAIDISYFEIGYIDETYFVRTAEGVSTEPVTSTMTVTCGVIRSADITMAVAFTQTINVGEIIQLELFAFTDAQLTAEAGRIRASNVDLASSTTLAVQATRIVYVLAEENSAFTLSAQSQRYRGITAAPVAAFSSGGPDDSNGDPVTDIVGTIILATTSTRTTAKLIGNING